MVEHLPEFIDPVALAEKRRRFRGSLPISKLSRLRDVLVDQEGVAVFELSFEKDGKIVAVTGLVEADLKLQCQCCLGDISWPVRSEVRLGVVHSLGEADLLPESYDPLLLETGTIPLADILQDELLLAIPAIPQHDRCGMDAAVKQEAAPKRPNPFAALAELKKSN